MSYIRSAGEKFTGKMATVFAVTVQPGAGR